MTKSVQQKSSRAPGAGRFASERKLNYGVGDAVVVVVSVVVDVAASGVEAAAGVVAVVVVVVLSEVLEVAGDGLFSGAGEAAGATVSVFCSQAARSAALARMQMYFFISLRIDGAYCAKG